MNDSSTGGYLVPLEPTAPTNDAALDGLFQAAIVGVTGLNGTMVRPRFQSEAPALPAFSVDWCAIGVIDIIPKTYGGITRDPNADGGLGRDIQQVWEELKVLASFYGPNAQRYASQTRAAFQIAQNREALQAVGILFSAARKPLKVPQLIKERWTNRIDLPLSFNRELTYSYAVRNLLTAGGFLDVDGRVQPFTSEGVIL